MPDIPEAAQRARQMYADGISTRVIMAETKLTLWQLYSWIDGRAKRNGPQLLPALMKRRIVKGPRIATGDRGSLVARIMRSAERQVAEVERRIGTENDQGEKDTRTLALIARTLRELNAIDRGNEQSRQGARAHERTDEVPRDVDALRRSLARKLEAIIAADEGPLPGDPEF